MAWKDETMESENSIIGYRKVKTVSVADEN